jgi:hypothetical protein
MDHLEKISERIYLIEGETVVVPDPLPRVGEKPDDFLRLAEEDHEIGYRILLNLARIVSARLRKADEDTIKLTTALSVILHEV